ncbi:MAG TPA: class II aldolase/adducin family protein, partial [Isosphaeraceae bacterium]|nr:class II aldolase/adducin family protein [Isosphaeraceae bacterium]
YNDDKAAELIKLKPNLGISDPRLNRGLENCDLCGNSLFRQGYGDFSPEPRVFIHPKLLEDGQPSGARVASPVPSQQAAPAATAASAPSSNGHAQGPDIDSLVKTITDQVMHALNGAAR